MNKTLTFWSFSVYLIPFDSTAYFLKPLLSLTVCILFDINEMRYTTLHRKITVILFENLFLYRSRWNFSSQVGNKCTPRSSIPAFGSFDAYWSELSDVLALSSSKAFSIRRHLCLTSGDRWRRQRWQADKIAKDAPEGFSSTILQNERISETGNGGFLDKGTKH